MKKNIFLHLFLCFIPLTVQAQTIAEFIKAGETLSLEWVQQKITRPEAPNHPLYPDQFQQGDWEIRFSLQLFRGKDDQVEGQIESVSFIHFSGEKWGTVEPFMADTRFQSKYPDVYTFYFNELTGLPFLANGSPAAYAAFQSALELKLEKAIAAYSGQKQLRSRIQSLELPEALQEKHWSAFIRALLVRDLPPEAYYLPLSIKKTGKQWLCNYFRLHYPPKTTLLEGKIWNQATEAVRLQFYKEGNWLDYWQDSLLTLDSDGHFKVAFPLGQARMVSISHGYHTMRFYLEPGDHLSFTTDANAFYRAMEFEGSAAAAQQFLLDFYHEMRGDTLFRSYDPELLQKEQLPFLAKQLQKENQELAFLELKGRSLSPGFRSIMERNIRFHYANIIWEAAYAFHIAEKEPLEAKFAQEAEQRRPLLYRLPPGKTYDFFVEEYLQFQLARLTVIGLDLPSSLERFNRFAQLVLNPETQIRHGAMLLFRNYSNENGLSASLLPLYEELMELCKDQKWRRELSIFSQAGAASSFTDPVIRFLPVGQPAPDWSFEDRDGVKVSLKDYRGRKVLLHIGWSQNLEAALSDITFFKEGQSEFPEVVHLLFAQEKEDFKNAVQNREGQFLYVPVQEMEILQDSYRVDNTSNHYNLLDENATVIANNYALGTPTKMRGAWAKINPPQVSEDWSTEDWLAFWRPLGIIAISLLFLTIIYLWRKRLVEKREFRKRQLLEFELKGIRAQMNPHFLFNAMSTIQNLIRTNRQEKADLYLSQFAGLMRRILRNTAEEYIPLSEEIATLEQYCSLEALRNPFDYEFNVHPDIDPHNTYIPGMILQPLLENAILHGLLPQKGPRKLWVEIQTHPKGLAGSVIDNGIGIDRAKEQKKQAGVEKGSRGIHIVQQRLLLLGDKDTPPLHFQDRSNLSPPKTGTQVDLIIPIEH